MKTIKEIPSPIAMVLAAGIIGASLVGAALVTTSVWSMANHSQTITQCYTIARGSDITGSLEVNGWTVEKTNLNQEILDACIKASK